MIRRDLKNMKKRRAAICFLMVFIMSFTALTGGISHMAIGGFPDVWCLIFCVVSTLVFAQIAARIANKAEPKVLNRITGIILAVLGVVLIAVNYLF